MFKDYLRSFNVVKGELSPIRKADITFVECIKQLHIVSDFSKIASRYNGIEGKMINNKTGRYYENIKMLSRRARKYICNLEKLNQLTIVEEYILSNTNEMLERGERALETIKISSYLEILKRSMNNTEISIGNTSFRNITRENGTIYYATLDDCNYNFIEMNAVDFVRRCKKKKIEIDYSLLIRDFVNYNDLSKSSEDLILALVSYPYEYMKWVNYYRLKKKELSEEEYKNKLSLSKIIDGDSIL
ncbi:hypothetical protein KQI30_09510 [Clostridium bornimense]|uniref:hypothetical protein n=1 Tax=Clostridium bornimense TaxID=1216932 RepID=UPI001C121AE7|nr:hypothetical protein [Clostridium bornimense]MBU5316505.1 hypothetical protein [Clostridium bornimense]